MVERRQRKADPLTRILHTCILLGWASFVAIQIILWLAKPEMETIVSRFYELEMRDYWLSQWVYWIPPVLGLCTIVSAISIAISPIRSRRKTDSKQINLFFLCALLLAMYAIYNLYVVGNTG